MPAKKKEPKKVEDEAPSGKCFNCEAPLGGEHYCYGCKQHVCDKCDKSISLPFGGHAPIEHLDTEDAEDHD